MTRNQFCARCRMVITFDAYNETLLKDREKESEIKAMQEKYDLKMKNIQDELESKFQQISQRLIRISYLRESSIILS